MNCPRCNRVMLTKVRNKKIITHCPCCKFGLDNAIQHLHLTVRPTKRDWYKELEINVTEWNGKTTRVGKLVDFYMVIDFIVNLLARFPKIVEIKEENSL